MKNENIAILITVYKDLANLNLLLERFQCFSVYIHVDKKSPILDDVLDMKKYKNIAYLSSDFSISWGSPAHLYAIINLMKETVKNKNIEYIHLISGQDFPSVSNNDIVQFSKKYKSNIFMTCKALNEISDKNIHNRFNYRMLFPNQDSRRIFGKAISFLERIQIFFPRKKIGKFTSDEIYKGMIWASFPKSFLSYILNDFDLEQFMKDLKRTKIAEEFFFQTIAMNSFWKDNVIKNNVRYTDWSGRNGSNPSILDMDDYSEIKSSNCIFVRKIDSNISDELRFRLNKETSS